ncbi:PREDICTED: aquaporin-4-like [Papilio xuthus]|uniref:Aquaporin-4-like n=1 Tax=Papilio xuthus TaxID=66420 RepID=A0AAJ6Z3S1_PAPXU|nr:PREDICTED: aquaporin-4-like [Papilio xuthus]
MAVTPGKHLANVIESVSVKCRNKLSDKILIKFCETWRAVLAEFISTLLLVLLGCLSCVPIQGLAYQPPLYAPLGFGFVVLFNIQAFAHISGAHMNPSVTLAAILWGKMSIGLGIAYMIAQCVGSILGYGILIALSPYDLITDGICTTQHHSALTVYQALAVEVILTAALNFLNCALWDPKNEKSLESVALKFGFTIAGLSIAGGPLTGCSMNPARSLGPAVWTGAWAAHWIYWVGPFLGGSLSAIFYKYVWLNNKDDGM